VRGAERGPGAGARKPVGRYSCYSCAHRMGLQPLTSLGDAVGDQFEPKR